jgi:hypothetical protein
MSSHGAATDWVVCRIFKRTKPGHGREDEVPSSPASSCVTDDSTDGNQEAEEDGEQSSSGGGDSSCRFADS